MPEQTACLPICLGLPWPDLAYLGLTLAYLGSSLNGTHIVPRAPNASSGVRVLGLRQTKPAPVHLRPYTCARTCPTLNAFHSFASLPPGLSEFDAS